MPILKKEETVSFMRFNPLFLTGVRVALSQKDVLALILNQDPEKRVIFQKGAGVKPVTSGLSFEESVQRLKDFNQHMVESVRNLELEIRNTFESYRDIRIQEKLPERDEEKEKERASRGPFYGTTGNSTPLILREDIINFPQNNMLGIYYCALEDRVQSNCVRLAADNAYIYEGLQNFETTMTYQDSVENEVWPALFVYLDKDKMSYDDLIDYWSNFSYRVSNEMDALREDFRSMLLDSFGIEV